MEYQITLIGETKEHLPETHSMYIYAEDKNEAMQKAIEKLEYYYSENDFNAIECYLSEVVDRTLIPIKNNLYLKITGYIDSKKPIAHFVEKIKDFWIYKTHASQDNFYIRRGVITFKIPRKEAKKLGNQINSYLIKQYVVI